MIRAANVLGVAALDTYVTDLFLEYFIVYIKKYEISCEFEKWLNEHGITTRKLLISLQKDNPYEEIRNIIFDGIEKYTTQRFEVIDKLFSFYGLNDLSKCAEDRSKKPDLLLSISKMIQRRHCYSKRNIFGFSNKCYWSRFSVHNCLSNNTQGIKNVSK